MSNLGFWTDNYSWDDFQPPPAKFSPPHSDHGLDTDGDNLYNYLVVEANVNVDEASDYGVSGGLYDNKGNWIDGEWTENYLETGIRTMELRFSGYRIRDSGENGPYRVYMNLRDDKGNWIDENEHWTAAYTYDQFQPPPFTIHIENDDFFNADNRVNGGGSGTEDDPYVIENWSIDASATHGIWIEDTTKYFVIRNCVVENGNPSHNRGIYLENVRNVESCELCY